jgi:hypothetical protein
LDTLIVGLIGPIGEPDEAKVWEGVDEIELEEETEEMV